MLIFTIIAYALLFWRAEMPGSWGLFPPGGAASVWGIVGVYLIGHAVGGWWTTRRVQRILWHDPDAIGRALHVQHRWTFLLRCGSILGFAGITLATKWPQWFLSGVLPPYLQVIGDLIVLVPFFAGTLILWLAAFPAERALRDIHDPLHDHDAASSAGAWRLGTYLDFHIRHHLLVAAVPMTIILFIADLLRGYEGYLRESTGWLWTPDALLTAATAVVFVAAPWMLCRIWRTSPLPAGPLRDRLEAMGRRIHLRFRDILVWNSNGLMINAAVMGIFAPVRYVLLSDALLSTMTPAQIEAVFGHEAGHVRHRHIQHFLLFALVGWLFVTGVMELLARSLAEEGAADEWSMFTVQAAGFASAALIWGLGFGWVSRRFERQADLFGARCVTPEPQSCGRPCSVHPGDQTSLPPEGRVCATAAATFNSALQRVAILNGIPIEERSWRHSSIGSRIRFLALLSGDPNLAGGFDRQVIRIKAALVATAVLGTTAALYYWSAVPQPALLRLHAGIP